MVFWSRDPDGSQHNQGDSLLKLTPGINGPTSMAAIRNADDDLSRVAARVLGARLAAQGLLVAGFGGTRALRASALIDAVHAVTMAVPAFGRSGRERAARLSGVCSLLSAAVASRIAARIARTA